MGDPPYQDLSLPLPTPRPSPRAIHPYHVVCTCIDDVSDNLLIALILSWEPTNSEARLIDVTILDSRRVEIPSGPMRGMVSSISQRTTKNAIVDAFIGITTRHNDGVDMLAYDVTKITPIATCAMPKAVTRYRVDSYWVPS